MKDLNSLWQSVLSELKLSLSKTIFQTLFANTDLKEYQNSVATISCPNPYLADLIEKRYYSLVKAAIDRQTGDNVSLSFMIEKIKSKEPQETGPLFNLVKKSANTILANHQFLTQNKSSGLSPNFTFKNFVVGDANHFAFAAAQGIVKSPGITYNPFFVWGGVGVGKTHLIQAIGHELTNARPDWKILYASAETFGSDLISSLKEKTINKFKQKYRKVDILIVDDIQFIGGKEYIQDEFFHTFNSLHLSGKQIILTSDRKPEEIQPLKDRLTSRFMGGLTVDIQSPDFEMRVAILKQKAEQRGVSLSENAITFIAETIESNARELEGSLIQIIAQSSAQKQIPDLSFVRTFFGIKKNDNHKKVSHRRIISVVAKQYQVKTSEIKGSCRKKNIATARHIAAYLLRKELQLPLEQVGSILGGKDHTTIMHAEEKIDRLFSTNQQIRHQIIEARKMIYS
ncbi:MAG: chromosomal replication initiator protein DnaA [Patescibacteria group bacterium]|nr:chromosomal replication initiator protein DnaA [Patescibacteria group bacterium]